VRAEPALRRPPGQSRPWEPGTGIGTPNANLTLFNSQGVALPSVGIRNPAAVCQTYDPRVVPCVVG
jgi:hypothetical protein